MAEITTRKSGSMMKLKVPLEFPTILKEILTLHCSDSQSAIKAYDTINNQVESVEFGPPPAELKSTPTKMETNTPATVLPSTNRPSEVVTNPNVNPVNRPSEVPKIDK
jgi:cell division septation protein DedD